MLELINLAAEVADLTVDRKRKAFIGAVAIRRDGVLVSSRNSATQHPSSVCPSIHAERRVLRKAGFGAKVYVARVLRNGTLAMSKPCHYCMTALRHQGVEIVYYSISSTEWGACRPL